MSYFRNPKTTQERRRNEADGEYARAGRKRRLPHSWDDIHKDDSKVPKKRCPECGQNRYWWHLYGNWWKCCGRDCSTQLEIRRRPRDRSTIRRAV